MTPDKFAPEVVATYENATWSRCAAGYMDGFGLLVRETLPRMLDEANVREGTRILDVGTGPGLLAAEAKSRGAEPIGLDFSEPMLDEARRRHPGIEFRAGSADALPFVDGSFDAVAGNFVLHHTARPEAVLSESRRVLSEGGRAVFTVWGDLAKLEAFGLFFGAVEEHAGGAELPHGPLFGISDFEVFRRMGEAAGFRETKVDEVEISWRMPTLEPFFAAFHDWANMSSFPEETKRSIEATIRERAERYKVPGGFVLPNPAIMVSAVR